MGKRNKEWFWNYSRNIVELLQTDTGALVGDEPGSVSNKVGNGE